MHAQDKTNHRLAVLTVFSAIFMPLTLMAGIWGMNFENMPELKTAIGYPLALGSMALIGLAMYLFFRKGGWFD
jgi:magnesium transporter